MSDIFTNKCIQAERMPGICFADYHGKTGFTGDRSDNSKGL